jgi:GrpB-like predicted nucleotidyltransferase (UPF0157 family)
LDCCWEDRSLGAGPRPVREIDVAFRRNRHPIRPFLGLKEHVGSTAIPDIVAKPVIDVLILVDRYDPEASYRGPLESLGYTFHHRDETHVFFEGSSAGMRVNVHVVEESSKGSRPMVAFRDYLRTHPEEARRYEDLKIALAKEHGDESAYADGKSAYVWGIADRA